MKNYVDMELAQKAPETKARYVKMKNSNFRAFLP